MGGNEEIKQPAMQGDHGPSLRAMGICLTVHMRSTPKIQTQNSLRKWEDRVNRLPNYRSCHPHHPGPQSKSFRLLHSSHQGCWWNHLKAMPSHATTTFVYPSATVAATSTWGPIKLQQKNAVAGLPSNKQANSSTSDNKIYAAMVS